MKQKHWNKIIEYFGVMTKSHPAPTMNDIQSINNKAVKAGYVVHPDVCNEIVEKWVESIRYNPNSTFYRKWKDITDRSRMQLFLDQLIHYASTYGTDFEAETYCPNGDPIEIDYQLYKVIEAVTDEELEKKIMDVLSSGIALKSDVVEAFCEWLLLLPQAIDIDTIKNREAMVYICTKLGIYPTNPETLVRYVFYITTGSPMLIQSREMLRMVKAYANRADFSCLTDEQLTGLASVFNRYKRIFMALKSYRANINPINKISRLSKKHHKPFQIGFWENITNIQHISEELLDRKVAELTNPFKIIKLLEMIKLRQLQSSNDYDRMFIIRNGKVWVDKDSKVPYPCDFDRIGTELLGRLVELMRDAHDNLSTFLFRNEDAKPIRVKLPNCTLVCPSSEKKFIGNIPMGSYYDMKDCNNYFGIYWRNEWGTRDFDLSFINEHNSKIGWNARYCNQAKDVIFSGDMTNADPEATEIILSRNNAMPDGTIYVNRFCGEEGSTYKLFFGQDVCSGFGRNYMVNPDSIILEDMLTSTVRQQMIGQVIDGRVYFFNLSNGDSRTSSKYSGYVKAQCLAHIELKPLLEAVGYEIVDENPDIDLSTPSKEKLLKLFI